jgi:hypothetical protein
MKRVEKNIFSIKLIKTKSNQIYDGIMMKNKIEFKEKK